MTYNIAVVGATGLVGSKMIEVLYETYGNNIELYLYASYKSKGKVVTYGNKAYKVMELNRDNIVKHNIDYALFSAGSNVSKEYAPIFVQQGATVIDNSSAYRMDDNVPLVVPEINAHDIDAHNGIIANPNCSTIQSVVAINNIHKKYKIKRIVYSTYQAVSGAGNLAIQDLKNDGDKLSKFIYPIKHNIIPHIDEFEDNGYTKEETKMINETKKILHDNNLLITATAARVPVYYGHSISINVELENKYDINQLRQDIADTKGVVVVDDIRKKLYPMPIYCKDKNEVFVGRIRRDFSVKSGVNLWVVADNIRKGAATNAVQILQSCIEKGER